jgi:hypothetical protein
LRRIVESDRQDVHRDVVVVVVVHSASGFETSSSGSGDAVEIITIDSDGHASCIASRVLAIAATTHQLILRDIDVVSAPSWWSRSSAETPIHRRRHHVRIEREVAVTEIDTWQLVLVDVAVSSDSAAVRFDAVGFGSKRSTWISGRSSVQLQAETVRDG